MAVCAALTEPRKESTLSPLVRQLPKLPPLDIPHAREDSGATDLRAGAIRLRRASASCHFVKTLLSFCQRGIAVAHCRAA